MHIDLLPYTRKWVVEVLPRFGLVIDALCYFLAALTHPSMITCHILGNEWNRDLHSAPGRSAVAPSRKKCVVSKRKAYSVLTAFV